MILVAIPAMLLALASLASFAGRWVWWLDVLANFRAQFFLVLAVLGVVVAVSARWRKVAYGILGVAVLNLAFVAPLFLGSPPQTEASLPTVRVLSFNLLSTNEEYVDVIEYIRSVDPDLVFLHEASRPWEVAVESAGLDYEVIRGRSDDLIFGTLVLARDEVKEAISFGFAENQPRAVQVVYAPDGWPVDIDVLSSHTLAPTTKQRAGWRDAQLDFAAKWAAEQTGAYVVVGDLNATPWSSTFSELLSMGHLRNSQVGFGLQPSFSAQSNVLLRVPIDHLLYSDRLTVRDRRLGPSLGSDHFPLLVDLQYLP